MENTSGVEDVARALWDVLDSYYSRNVPWTLVIEDDKEKWREQARRVIVDLAFDMQRIRRETVHEY